MHISAPAASLVRSRSCRALSACLLLAFRRLRALGLRSLSPYAWPRAPSHASLTPLLATPPSPSSACSRSSRACSCCYRVFLRSCLSPRAFALCCYSASLTPQSRRARSPLPVQAPCRTRDVAPLASGVAVLLAHVCVLRCCCRASSLWLRSLCSLTFLPRAHPDASPRTPRTDRLWTSVHWRSLPLRVPWLFTCSLRC